ncbi:hypothetical protein Droror1_Dr00025122 [Drosera rotundifolia]
MAEARGREKDHGLRWAGQLSILSITRTLTSWNPVFAGYSDADHVLFLLSISGAVAFQTNGSGPDHQETAATAIEEGARRGGAVCESVDSSSTQKEL